ncbi:2,3-dihydro-2,3-dihydroxybenzoate dehydrogenase [enterobactin] siderophore [Enterobacter hormaechei]|nr:2,3-dihydro-2,3-dihydroxybenzoate dehydrogenase [enterobactin] siderophore [Enterobacter hormaechei]
MTLADIDALINVNIRGVVIAIQEALVHMSDGGRIINIGSCLANRVAQPGIAVYSMTKSALNSLTRGLARDLGPRGITVNLVHPGPTNSDMNPEDGEQADSQRQLIAWAITASRRISQRQSPSSPARLRGKFPAPVWMSTAV